MAFVIEFILIVEGKLKHGIIPHLILCAQMAFNYLAVAEVCGIVFRAVLGVTGTIEGTGGKGRLVRQKIFYSQVCVESLSLPLVFSILNDVFKWRINRDGLSHI